MTAVLEAIGMEKRFPVKQQMLLRRRDTFQALQGIDLALYSGQTLGVVGESGSGKSESGCDRGRGKRLLHHDRNPLCVNALPGT